MREYNKIDAKFQFLTLAFCGISMIYQPLRLQFSAFSRAFETAYDAGRQIQECNKIEIIVNLCRNILSDGASVTIIRKN